MTAVWQRTMAATVVAVLVGWCSTATPGPKSPSYKLREGKGYTVCEAYLKNLRAFRPDEPSPVCTPRPHSTSKQFKELNWEPMDVSRYLEQIYEAEMTWGPFAGHPERHPSFPDWRAEFEAAVGSGLVRPSLKSSIIEFVDRKPQKFVAYARNPRGCEAELASQLYSQNVGHRLFRVDESTGAFKSGGPVSDDGGAVLLLSNRPVVVTADRGANEVYVWVQVPNVSVFAAARRCVIDVAKPN